MLEDIKINGVPLEEIEEAAKAATLGPWEETDAWVVVPNNNNTGRKWTDTNSAMDAKEDRTHIATSDPPTVLALCAEVRRLMGYREREAADYEIDMAKLRKGLELTKASRRRQATRAEAAETRVRELEQRCDEYKAARDASDVRSKDLRKRLERVREWADSLRDTPTGRFIAQDVDRVIAATEGDNDG